MSTVIVSDESRIHAAAEEMFGLVFPLLDSSTRDFISELLFVGEEGIAIDVMTPYYATSAARLSPGSLTAMEDLHELQL